MKSPFEFFWNFFHDLGIFIFFVTLGFLRHPKASFFFVPVLSFINYSGGGGGGGYSGGGVTGSQTKGTAGGGRSYNIGTNQQNVAGVNKGDGKVIITLMSLRCQVTHGQYF